MITWALREFVSWHARQVITSLMGPRLAQQRALGRLGTFASLDSLRTAPSADTTSGPVLGFMRTSGSRGEPKLIPITRAYLRSLDRTLMRMVCTHIFTTGDWSHAFTGRHVFLSSRPRVGTTDVGLPIFDASALYPTRASWFVRWLLIPRHSDLWLDDWATKRSRILEQARTKNVISLNGLPALAFDFMQHAKGQGISWPHLRQFSYGGVPFRAEERERLNTLCGRELTYLETYFASEAPLGFALDPKEDGLALNLLENVYTFKAGEQLLLADEVKTGERYSLHVTTPGGLVNFRMGDLVDVISTKPLLVRIAGREGEELSLTGEKLTLAQIDLALEAIGAHGTTVVWKGDNRLVWGSTAPLDPGQLDDALCRFNVLYNEALRIERVIQPSEVRRLDERLFAAHRAKHLGNYKPKRLFESREAFTAEYEAPPAGSGGS